MHRILSLVCVVLLFTIALPLLAQPEIAPNPPQPKAAPAQPAAQQPPQKGVIRRVNLRFIATSECLKLLGTSTADGGMKEQVPKDIITIVGLVGLNAVLVRGENEQAVDQMEALLRMIDDQAIQHRIIIVELLAVELPEVDAETILAKQTQRAEGDTPSIENKLLLQVLGPMVDGKRSSMRSKKLLMKRSPHGGVVDLREWNLSHEALWYFGVRMEKDDLVLFATPILPVVPEQVETILGAEPPLPLHIALRHAVLIDSQPAAGDATRRQLLFLIHDGFMVQDDAANREVAPLPPLF